MDLLNKKVSHKHFGKGHIINQTENTVEVEFAEDIKKFIFPDAFGKFLKLHDEKAIDSIKEVIQEKINEEMEEQQRIEEEKKKRQLRLEHRKLMKKHKLHPQSQVVFWCDEEEQGKVFEEWQFFIGVIKSGQNKGTPRKLSRLQPNSACLLTARDANEPEKERRIIGVYMVKEDFVGKLREDGYVPAHSEYRIKLTEQESKEMPFWKYYINENSPENTTWNSGNHRYFDNLQMAQILKDLISLKENSEVQELAQQMFDYYCRLNRIVGDEIPKPNGALLQLEPQLS